MRKRPKKIIYDIRNYEFDAYCFVLENVLQ